MGKLNQLVELVESMDEDLCKILNLEKYGTEKWHKASCDANNIYSIMLKVKELSERNKNFQNKLDIANKLC